MNSVAFDTLKLTQRLEAAGFPAKQAQDMASAIADTIVDTVVTREYLDLRLGTVQRDIGDLKSDTATKLAELKADLLKWMLGAIGFQTLAIIAGVLALSKLLGH